MSFKKSQILSRLERKMDAAATCFVYDIRRYISNLYVHILKHHPPGSS